MSGFYNIFIRIEDTHTLEDDIVLKIKKELRLIWFSDGLNERDEIDTKGERSVIEGVCEGCLHNNKNKEIFVEYIVIAVWGIAGKFIPVNFEITDLTPQKYTFDEKYYNLHTEKKGLET